ncbi:unnamed protein product [Amoebophrya sp. A25]|nr:unnamed protein product [Amoebophrya sp. A25]|eukprot:GSA25T00018034001.1
MLLIKMRPQHFFYLLSGGTMPLQEVGAIHLHQVRQPSPRRSASAPAALMQNGNDLQNGGTTPGADSSSGDVREPLPLCPDGDGETRFGQPMIAAANQLVWAMQGGGVRALTASHGFTRGVYYHVGAKGIPKSVIANSGASWFATIFAYAAMQSSEILLGDEHNKNFCNFFPPESPRTSESPTPPTSQSRTPTPPKWTFAPGGNGPEDPCYHILAVSTMSHKMQYEASWSGLGTGSLKNWGIAVYEQFFRKYGIGQHTQPPVVRGRPSPFVAVTAIDKVTSTGSTTDWVNSVQSEDAHSLLLFGPQKLVRGGNGNDYSQCWSKDLLNVPTDFTEATGLRAPWSGNVGVVEASAMSSWALGLWKVDQHKTKLVEAKGEIKMLQDQPPFSGPDVSGRLHIDELSNDVASRSAYRKTREAMAYMKNSGYMMPNFSPSSQAPQPALTDNDLDTAKASLSDWPTRDYHLMGDGAIIDDTGLIAAVSAGASRVVSLLHAAKGPFDPVALRNCLAYEVHYCQNRERLLRDRNPPDFAKMSPLEFGNNERGDARAMDFTTDEMTYLQDALKSLAAPVAADATRGTLLLRPVERMEDRVKKCILAYVPDTLLIFFLGFSAHEKVPFFGYKLFYLKYYRTFHIAGLSALLRVMYRGIVHGLGPVATIDLQTVENKHFKIEAGRRVRVTFVAMFPDSPARTTVPMLWLRERADWLRKIRDHIYKNAPRSTWLSAVIGRRQAPMHEEYGKLCDLIKAFVETQDPRVVEKYGEELGDWGPRAAPRKHAALGYTGWTLPSSFLVRNWIYSDMLAHIVKYYSEHFRQDGQVVDAKISSEQKYAPDVDPEYKFSKTPSEENPLENAKPWYFGFRLPTR